MARGLASRRRPSFSRASFVSQLIARFARLPAPLRFALLAGLCFLLNLGGPPLFDVDEGAFSAATMEMLARGDYVMTYLAGAPRFDKPILIYWLQAASVGVFGLNEWALRLPSALAAIAWMWLVWRFARRFGETTGLYAALIVGSAFGPLAIGRAATADALLNFLLAGALLDAWRVLEGGGRAPLLRMYAWIGVGLLAKGPIAILVPGMAVFFWCLFSREWRRMAEVAIAPLGWLIALAIAGPWYVAIYLDQGQAFIDGFIMKHNVGRFSGNMLGHGGSVGYYLALLPVVLLPFSGLFLAVAAGIRAQWRDPLDRYLWTAFGAVFVFFSLSHTQLPHYILYGMTPLAILMARHRERLRSGLLAFAPLLLAALAALLLPEIAAALLRDVQKPQFREMLGRIGETFGPAYRLGWGQVVSLALVLWIGRLHRPTGLAIVAPFQVAAVVLLLLPAAGQWQQGPVVELARKARPYFEPVVAWGVNYPSFGVYYGRVVPLREPMPGEIVLTREERLERLPRLEILHRSGGLLLGRVKDASHAP